MPDISTQDDDNEILIALVIHRKQTILENGKIVGPIYGRIRVIDHYCNDQDGIVFLGRRAGGIDVEVNRRIVMAEGFLYDNYRCCWTSDL
jgi:nickel-dependent lactate racemase